MRFKPRKFAQLGIWKLVTVVFNCRCEVVGNGRRLAHSRQSDRPQSSMSSALTNGMVYGCGGKCQTIESVCYFVLQVQPPSLTGVTD